MPHMRVQLGGLNLMHDPPPGAASVADNLRKDRYGAWCEAYGSVSLFQGMPQDPFTVVGIGEVETMFSFAQHQGGRKFVIWEHRTSPSSAVVDLVVFNGSTRSYTTIQSNRLYSSTPWWRTLYAEHNGWVYCTNGYDAPIRWNGRWTMRVGFPARAAPPVPISRAHATPRDYWYTNDALTWGDAVEPVNSTLRKGVGTTAPNYTSPGETPTKTGWAYGYAVQWENDLGFKSPPSNVVIVYGDNQGGDYTSPSESTMGRTGALIVMPPCPDWVRAQYLLRTENIIGLPPNEARNQQLYVHTRVPSAVTTTIVDLKSDGELGEKVDANDTGAVPEGMRGIVFWRGRSIAWGMHNEAGSVRLSPVGKLEQWPDDFITPIGGAAGGEVIACYPARGVCFVVKRRGIYAITDTYDGGVQVNTLAEGIGGVSPKGICEVPGLGLLVVTEDGPVVVTGTVQPGAADGAVDTKFAEPIFKDWDENVNRTALCTAVAKVNRRDREVMILVPGTGKARPSMMYVYHYATGDWSRRPNWPYSDALETQDSRQWVLLASNNTSQPGVHLYGDAATSMAGTTNTATWRSAPIRDPDGGRISSWDVSPRVVAFGARDMTVTHYLDRKFVADNTQTVQLRDHERDFSRWWGGTTYSSSDSETWDDYTLQTVKFDIAVTSSPLELQIQFAATKMTLVDAVLQLEGHGMSKQTKGVTR